MSHDNCPTCGTKLGSLRDHARVRVCTSCQRPNPRGFRYCGFCAAPMENTELRAHIAKVAAPPGGWPSLARELLEVRFFLDRGDVGEAFEMVQLLRQRWPGHPQLEEFHGMSPNKRPRRVHTGVNEVVDAVLADSADWASRAPRRAAPQWQAPAAPSAGRRTQAHEVVEPAQGDASTVVTRGGVRKRVEDGSGLRERDTRRGYTSVGAFPVVPVINPAFRDSGPQAVVEGGAAPAPEAGKPAGKQRIVRDDDTAVFHRGRPPAAAKPAAGRITAPQLVPPEPPPGLTIDRDLAPTPVDGTPHLVAASGSLVTSDDQPDQAAESGSRSRTYAEARPSEAEPPSGDRTVVGPAPTRGPGWSPPKGLTIAVDALQPAQPYEDDEEPAAGTDEGDDEDVDTVRRPEDDGAATPSRRKLRGKGAQAKKKGKRRPAAPAEDGDDEEKRAAKAKRRAAKFGQSIVGR